MVSDEVEGVPRSSKAWPRKGGGRDSVCVRVCVRVLRMPEYPPRRAFALEVDVSTVKEAQHRSIREVIEHDIEDNSEPESMRCINKALEITRSIGGIVVRDGEERERVVAPTLTSVACSREGRRERERDLGEEEGEREREGFG